MNDERWTLNDESQKVATPDRGLSCAAGAAPHLPAVSDSVTCTRTHDCQGMPIFAIFATLIITAFAPKPS